MTFAVGAEAYDRHVGRYGIALGAALAKEAGIHDGMRVLDVGAGTGKLTRVLAGLAGEENVAAVDPSEPFVATLRADFPAVDVRLAAAENLPFADATFDAALAQLVVNFMSDPHAGIAEMRRVTRDEGVIAAAVWDYPGGMTLLRTFWEAAATLDPEGVADRDERTNMLFDEEGELAELWRSAGLRDVQDGQLSVSASYDSFDDLWEPFVQGVAPSGAYASSVGAELQEALRSDYRRRLGSPAGPFRLEASAWYAVGRK